MLGQVEYSSYINLINRESQTWGSENIDLMSINYILNVLIPIY